MTTAIQFAVLGLGGGAIYALSAQGLVVIYGGAGVLNFAQGAQAMLGAYLFWQLRVADGWAFAPSFVVTVAAVTGVGVAVYWGVMRPLRRRSSISRVVATLGLLLILESTAALIWGTPQRGITSDLPARTFVVHGVFVPLDRLLLVVIATGMTILLTLFFRFTRLGLAIKATAQNPRAAASLGWSPDVLATATWAAGSALAGVAGILIAPIVGLDIGALTQLVIPVMAAALLGGFSSLVLTLIGAIGIGIADSEVQVYVHLTGASWAVPFALIVLLMLVRGKGLPVRSYFAERLPEVGSGEVRWRLLAPAVAGACVLLAVFPPRLLDAVTVSLAWAILMLSVVVLLGYTSQLSFEQMAMAGLASLVAARLVANAGWPFPAALAAAVLAAVPIGVMFAVPALRTRGVNLAVVTLGLGMVVSYMVFANVTFTGAADGIQVGSQTFFGLSIDTVTHPARYAIIVLVAFVVCGLAVANVRRGRAGSALIAVRTNERAAAALGISVFRAKLFAFMLGSAVAAIGGVFLSFRNYTVLFDDFDPFQSVLVVAYAVIGGVGLLMGPAVAAMMVAGGLGGWILAQFYSPTTGLQWLTLLSGITVILVLLQDPDGVAGFQARMARLHGRQLHWLGRRLVALALRRPTTSGSRCVRRSPRRGPASRCRRARSTSASR